jgi:beta-glucosidase
MKKLSFILLCVFAFQFNFAQPSDMSVFIYEIMQKMTLEEKIGQLNQLAPAGWVQTGSVVSSDIEKKIIEGNVGSILNSLNPEITRNAQELAVTKSHAKIPILFGLDVIHGFKTIFPIPLALSCSWDLERIEASAAIAAKESSAAGINWTFSPMVDLSRDPRWGRVAEGSGEDPWWGAQVGAAMVKGYQGKSLADERTILACVKHFALYGAAEGGRDYNTVDMSRLSMYQTYFPPYQLALQAGAGSVMTAFNVVDGVPASGNKWLFTDVLRGQWGFDGFVVTDYRAINEMIDHGLGNHKTVSGMAMNAGIDMDMVGEGFLNYLKQLVEEGVVPEQRVDDACRKVLEAKYKLGLFDDPYRYIDKERIERETLTAENLRLARELAQRTVILLKNEKEVLPLKKGKKIAVIGPLGHSKIDMLGTWVVAPDTTNVTSLYDGIKNAGGQSVSVKYAQGSLLTEDKLLDHFTRFPFGQGTPGYKLDTTGSEKLLKEAIELAKQSEVIIAAVGEPAAWSGEGASRSEISIPDCQKRLLKALKATGKPMVIVVFGGRPLTLEWENENFDAILFAWHGGTEAGNALADVIYGDYNPSGKITMSFPINVGQIPIYYNYLNTGRPSNPFNKYSSKYIDVPNLPLFPFGYGLSYTTFDYSEIKLSDNKPYGNVVVSATVEVKNTGNYMGEEVVQLYIADPVASVSRPVKELKGFRKIALNPGESQNVTFEITVDDLKYYDTDLNHSWDEGEFIVFVGTNSRDVKSVKLFWGK